MSPVALLFAAAVVAGDPGTAAAPAPKSPKVALETSKGKIVLELDAVDNLALHAGFTRTRMGRVHWSEQARIARELHAELLGEFAAGGRRRLLAGIELALGQRPCTDIAGAFVAYKRAA